MGDQGIPIGQKAYADGVKQIVHISAISAGFPWRSTLISTIYSSIEEILLSTPGRGAYVALRPFHFMLNLVLLEARTINDENSIIDVSDPGEPQEWISTSDIGTVAANIFQNSIEKHGDAVYNLVGDVVTRKDHAALLSKAVGRAMTYKKVTTDVHYNNLISLGYPHSVVYTFLGIRVFDGKVTPGLSILLGRPPQTLEQWLEENKAALV